MLIEKNPRWPPKWPIFVPKSSFFTLQVGYCTLHCHFKLYKWVVVPCGRQPDTNDSSSHEYGFTFIAKSILHVLFPLEM